MVYNHLGPDGNYLGLYSPSYFSEAHETPWGAAVNLDGPGERARPGLLHRERPALDPRVPPRRAAARRLPRPGRRVAAALPGRAAGAGAGVGCPERKVLIIAEDSRNLVRMVQPEAEGGWGLDAVWADDLHHQLRVGLAGDRDGYYADFTGSLEDVARTIRDGWFFQGQRSGHFGGPRGTDPTGAPPRRFVVCLQNHDQVGNRALGERLHHQVDLAPWRAASALLLLGPETPLLFMGQEWGATSPFLFFTDHNPELGAPGDRGPAEGVRRLPGVRRSRGAGPHPRPPDRGDLPPEPARLGRDGAGAARGPAAAHPGPAARSGGRLGIGTLYRDEYRVAALPDRGVALPGRCRGETARAPPGGGVSPVGGRRGSREPGRATGPRGQAGAGGCGSAPRTRPTRPTPALRIGGSLDPMPRIRFERPGTLVLGPADRDRMPVGGPSGVRRPTSSPGESG